MSETTRTIDPALVSQFLPFNPFDPDFHADPYPVFRDLRASNGPVIRTSPGAVSVIGHDETSAVLHDHRFGWGDGALFADQFIPSDEGPPVRPFFLMDPPDHTRLRSLVTKAFSARAVERLRDRAQELADKLLVEVRTQAADGPVDLMEAFAGPLPALLLGELMGLAEGHDDERFKTWAADSGRGLDPSFVLTPEQITARDAARAGFRDYFTALAAERRARPGDDLVSELVAVEESGDRLTETELVITCTTLLAAGYGTTVNLIGNGMLALLRNPEQLRWLREHPERIPDAVQELLRYDSPVRLTSRVALEEAEIGGITVMPGETVFLVIGAANRDPAAHPDPDRLDVSRTARANLGFGIGIHYCIGAPMARLTAQAAFASLIRLDLDLVGDTPPPYLPGLVLRGLAGLPVTSRTSR